MQIIKSILLDTLFLAHQNLARDDRAYTKSFKERYLKERLIMLNESLNTLNSIDILPKFLYIRLLRNNEIWLLNTETLELYYKPFNSTISLDEAIKYHHIVAIYTVDHYNAIQEIEEMIFNNFSYNLDQNVYENLDRQYYNIDLNDLLTVKIAPQNTIVLLDDLPF